MTKLFISTVEVIEGHLYEVWGEDSKLVVYDQFVRVICDGEVWDHIHIFYGTVADREGFHHPNFNAKAEAERLAARVHDRGWIDTKHWHHIGNITELRKSELERLEESWSDVSDHYESYYG